LKAANGLDIPILGEVRLKVKIDGYTTQVVGLVSDHIPEPVLGINFISGNKVVLNYAKNIIQITNQSYPLHRESNRSQVNTTSPLGRRSGSVMRTKLSRPRRGYQLEGEHGVNAVSATEGSPVTISDAEPAIGDVLKFWSLKELHTAQKADHDTSHILTMMEASTEKPPWYLVTSQAYDVQSLLEAWPRLRVCNGITSEMFRVAIPYNDDVAGDLTEGVETRVPVCNG